MKKKEILEQIRSDSNDLETINKISKKLGKKKEQTKFKLI